MRAIGVESGDAGAHPVAAGTAGTAGSWRVLVTGASGGEGRFAVQLAHLGGTEVVAVVGSEARGAALAALGADSVVIGIDAVGGKVDVASWPTISHIWWGCSRPVRCVRRWISAAAGAVLPRL